MSRLPTFLVLGILSLAHPPVSGAASNYTTPYVFSGLAGEPSVGSTDGSGASARFSGPLGSALDSAGNLYVADEKNQTIRKVTPAGVVTTVAGAAGFAGFVDGPVATARFRLPKGVAVDATGNVYVVDMGNQAVRKISPAGEVTTIAGNGSAGGADGTGTAARFNIPSGITLAPGGDLFVADAGNNTIRRVTPNGVVTTYAGKAGVYGAADGTGEAASFFYPIAVTADSAGTLYVAEVGNYTIRKITAGAVVTTLAGTAGKHGTYDGVGAAAAFKSPAGIAVDNSGSVYVADWSIRKITPAGEVTTVAGNRGSPGGSTDGIGAAAQFSSPGGIAVDAVGTLYVSDRDNNTIRKIMLPATVTTFAGVPPETSQGSANGASNAARFFNPSDIAPDGHGGVYVSDTNNHTIRHVGANGAVTTFAGSPGQLGTTDGVGAAARFTSPQGLASDAQGNLYVADSADRVRKITPSGAVSTLAGGPGLGSADGMGPSASFRFLEALATDASGNVYVADTGNHTIRKVTPAGAVTTLAGAAGVSGSADGSGVNARFWEPGGVVVGRDGNVIVADSVNNTIRKITPAGEVTTLAGKAGVDGSADGPGADARFWRPAGLAVDAAGNIFVADTVNQTIRRIAPDGTVSTVGGLPQVKGSAPGKGELARFNSPGGLTFDARGMLYVVNNGGNTVVLGAVEGRPVITTQPLAVAVAAGGTAQFSVAANGDPTLAYQWYRNGAALTGATAAALSIAGAQAANAGDYTVVVTNSKGTETSSVAVLTVTTAPVTPPAPPPASGGSGGGGGAPSLWFVGSLVMLVLARLRSSARGEITAL